MVTSTQQRPSSSIARFRQLVADRAAAPWRDTLQLLTEWLLIAVNIELAAVFGLMTGTILLVGAFDPRELFYIAVLVNLPTALYITGLLAAARTYTLVAASASAD